MDPAPNDPRRPQVRIAALAEPQGPRERRREAETLRIVAAALALFLDRSPDEVTADEIAEAASISRRTFFRYFPSKDDVLVMVHARSMRRVARAIRDRPIDEPFVTAIVSASRSVAELEVNAKEAALNELSTRMLLRHPEAWERVLRQAGREIEQELEAALAFRLSRAGLPTAPARPLAAVAWSVGCGVFRDWLASGGKGGITDNLEIALQQVRSAI
jgi:AcrR family transcriptional regulator